MKTGRKMEKNKISKKADSGQQVLSSNEKNIITLRKAKTKELLCIWSFLIIPLINLCIFWVYGTIQSFPIAFEHRFIIVFRCKLVACYDIVHDGIYGYEHSF